MSANYSINAKNNMKATSNKTATYQYGEVFSRSGRVRRSDVQEEVADFNLDSLLFCAKNDLILKKRYADVCSAFYSSRAKRTRMLEDALAGKFHTLIVKNLEQLSLDDAERESFKTILNNKKILVIEVEKTGIEAVVEIDRPF